jgi:hypothetical protein
MKKVIVVCIVMAMVICLSEMASASESQWTVYLRAGVLTGTTWSYSQSASRFGVQAAASSSYHASLQSNAVGIYGVDPDPNKMANKDYRAADIWSYVWHFKLATGSAWNPDNKITVGWYCPISTEAPSYFSPIFIYRNGLLQNIYRDDEVYGSSAIKVAATDIYLASGTTENWTVCAWCLSPEPAGIFSLVGGLVCLFRPMRFIARKNGK